MSSPARRPLDSTVRQKLPENFRFRILVVGKSRSGKSSLVKTVFKVDMTAAPEKTNINVEFRPDDNRYLIVHEFSGLDSQARDTEDLQTVRDFISRRTDPSRSPSERLHAVWICVPASDAIDGKLGGGVQEILGSRSGKRVQMQNSS
jgi:predicted GTPase